MRNRLLAATLAAISLGATLAFVFPLSAEAALLDTNANLPDPIADFASAKRALPFTIHLPDPAPDGAVPLVVDWFVDKDSIGSFDMWWSLPGQYRAHIWETNEPESSMAASGKDPVALGERVSVNGVPWMRDDTNWGMTEFCSPLSDGVIVCFASNLGPTWTAAVAGTIT